MRISRIWPALLALVTLSCSGARDEQRDLDAHPLRLGVRGDPPLDPGEALVKGFIRSETTRLPVANVEVLLRSRGTGAATSQLNALTDAKGRFTAIVPADHYQLFTQHCDYQPQVVELDASEAAPAQVAVFLNPLGPGKSSCARE